MSADGKIATANRAIASFGSARDHEHLLELRATADAVMAGARTVDGDAVNLGPGGLRFRRRRRARGLAEFNLRVVISGSGSINPRAEIFRQRFSPVIILTTRRAPARQLATLRRVADVVKIFGAEEVDLRAALVWLRTEWKIQRLVCEGGGALNDAMFRAGLVDELHLTVCPKIFGGRNAPTIAEGIGFSGLANAAQFELHSARQHDEEMFFTFRRRA